MHKVHKNPVIRSIKNFAYIMPESALDQLATNEDVFHTLLYTSDPYISSHRKTYEYSKSVKALDFKSE